RNIQKMIVKNTQDRNKITNSLPGLFDEKGEINDGELAKIKANVDKIAKLTVDNPDLVTDNEIDQAKIDDLKNGIKNILDIDSADPLPDT
ncbi:10476_t:CDS:1, partial [Gigaspora margarita]